MKLFFNRKAKDPIYYAQYGYRTPEGKSTTKNVRRFGKHSELLKITDDPEAYCREQIKLMNEEYKKGTEVIQIALDFNKNVANTGRAYSRRKSYNIGYLYLQLIYQKLELKDFFDEITAGKKMTFDPNTINRFLTFSRVLDPMSKAGTFDNLDTYYERPKFEYHQIFRFMDLLYEHSDKYLEWLYDKSNNIIKRDSSVIYYDCTNFYFETEQADEDEFDDKTGEIVSYGLRKYGVSKEHRPNPIVEMGLMMDKRGIPINMCIHPGNTSEQVTATPLEEKIIPNLDASDIIYCADAGLGSYSIRKFNSLGGRRFIVTQSIKKLSDTLKEAVFNDFDYRLLSDDSPITIERLKSFDRSDPHNEALYNAKAYKIIPADKAIDLGLTETKELKNGKKKEVKSKGTLKQNVIVTFSRKMMEYQRSVRNRQIERAKNILKRKDPEEIKKGTNDVKRFMKRIAETKSGEKASVTYELDLDKIKEEEKYDGYYAIATNLLDDSPRDIMAVMSERYRIEESFRIMKTNLCSRGVYHHEERRIRTHFMICYTALLIYRLLECSIQDNGDHVTIGNLIKTLRNMTVSDRGAYIESEYDGSEALYALNKLGDLSLIKEIYKPSEFNKKIKKILK